MAEYNVACGVLPPGLVQSFFAAIAAISSWQFIGVPVSVSTFAAASMALRRLGSPFALAFLVVLAGAASATFLLVFFLAMLLLLKFGVCSYARDVRCVNRAGQLPRVAE